MNDVKQVQVSVATHKEDLIWSGWSLRHCLKALVQVEGTGQEQLGRIERYMRVVMVEIKEDRSKTYLGRKSRRHSDRVEIGGEEIVRISEILLN